MPKRLTARDQRVIDYRQANPCSTGTQIGQALGISRERARQIVVKNGLWHGHIKKQHECRNCGKPVYHKRMFCNRKCQYEYLHVQIVCDNCGTIFRRLASDILYRLGEQHLFCSKKCRNSWMKNHAIKTISKKIRYSPDEMVKLRLQDHLTIRQISEKIGVSVSTIQLVLRQKGVSTRNLLKENIIRLIVSGKTVQEVCRELYCKDNIVYRWIIKLGLPYSYKSTWRPSQRRSNAQKNPAFHNSAPG